MPLRSPSGICWASANGSPEIIQEFVVRESSRNPHCQLDRSSSAATSSPFSHLQRKLDQVTALATLPNVELMTHPVVPCETEYLMSDEFSELLRRLEIGGYALV
jgi:hypothetical protein